MKGFLLFVFILVSYAVFMRAFESDSLSAAEKAVLLKRADALVDASRRGDAETIIASTHPVVFNVMSREEFVRVVRQSVALILEKSATVSHTWGEPSRPYVCGSDEVCFLPRESMLHAGNKRGVSKGFLIATRKKGTKDWLFLDGHFLRKNPELLWKLFPELPRDIELPPNKLERIE